MSQDQVELLEEELEAAIGRVVRRLAKTKQIKVPPSNRTHHLMAKAAVAVLEAVADEEEK
jgi:propanediol utilization protein